MYLPSSLLLFDFVFVCLFCFVYFKFILVFFIYIIFLSINLYSGTIHQFVQEMIDNFNCFSMGYNNEGRWPLDHTSITREEGKRRGRGAGEVWGRCGRGAREVRER